MTDGCPRCDDPEAPTRRTVRTNRPYCDRCGLILTVPNLHHFARLQRGGA